MLCIHFIQPWFTLNDLLRGRGLMLQVGTGVDARLIASLNSTKNANGKFDT
jgi:hypothetical protein